MSTFAADGFDTPQQQATDRISTLLQQRYGTQQDWSDPLLVTTAIATVLAHRSVTVLSAAIGSDRSGGARDRCSAVCVDVVQFAGVERLGG